jgi:hypothetical protein
MLHLILSETNEYLTGFEGDQKLHPVQQDLSHLHKYLRHRQTDADNGRTKQGRKFHPLAREEYGNRHYPRRRRACILFKPVRNHDTQRMA